MMRAASLLCCALLLFSGSVAAAPPVPATPHSGVPKPAVYMANPTKADLTGVKIRTYEVHGATAQNLQDQMRQLGPQDPQGDKTYGDTVWNLTYAYQTAFGPGGYSVAGVQLQPEIVLVLPQWNPPAGAPAALVAEWRRFHAALLLHERGHVRHARQAIAEIRRALTTMPAYSTSAALSGAVQDAVDRITTKYRDLDVQYDRQTRHGATQGAVFPSTVPRS